MTAFVVDMSVVLAWMLPGEAHAEKAARLIEALRTNGGIAPALWRWEVANGIIMAERRQRLTPADVTSAFARVAQLPITLDPESPDSAWNAVAELAHRHRLTAYDAAYLELAVRRGIAIATFDNELRRAAAAERVPLID